MSAFFSMLFLVLVFGGYIWCLIDGIIITWNASPILLIVCFIFHVPLVLIGLLHVCFDINVPKAIVS